VLVQDERDSPNFFAGPYIDRRGELRESAGWRDAALSDNSTLYVVSRGTTHLLVSEPEPHIAFVTGEHASVLRADESSFVLLGWFRGTRCVLIELDETANDDSVGLPGAHFEELRPLTNVLPADEAGLLAYARALSIWRSRNRFCGRCGSRTLAERGGHVLRCSNAACAQEVFPRIDPAIIVLVSDGDRALLGRQATWPKGRYSTIAGFVEPGESLEDAVAREVLEETGVEVVRSRYHSSQPWPFPSSLMIGYHAIARPGSEVRVVGGELEDARWFTREDLLSTPPIMPPSQAISYRLIRTWLDGKSG
jgi:NAD+ diphosphatase